MFNKEKCISNIYQLAKEKGLKIGDLEKSVGVSTGYLSRLNKGENTTVPSVDFIANVAEVLGVTVDALLNNDYSSPTPTEKYLLAFIDKLMSQTNADKLDWKKETLFQLRSVDCDNHGNPEHILYAWKQEGSSSVVAYDSKFNPRVDVSGDCYYLSLPGQINTVVYLICVDDPEVIDTQFANDAFELYMVQNLNVTPLCSSLLENSPFCEALSKLYVAVTESSKHPKLESNVMSAIDAFMNYQTLEDLEPDEELPF